MQSTTKNTRTLSQSNTTVTIDTIFASRFVPQSPHTNCSPPLKVCLPLFSVLFCLVPHNPPAVFQNCRLSFVSDAFDLCHCLETQKNDN